MTPFSLSITGVAFAVFGQSQVAAFCAWTGLANVFCQATLPLSASIANKVSSAPSTKSMFLGPCEVTAPATTTGAVRVESAISVGGVASCVLHCTASLDTLVLVRLVSDLFQP